MSTSQEYDAIADMNIDLHRFEHRSLNTEQNNIEDVHVQSITSIAQTLAR